MDENEKTMIKFVVHCPVNMSVGEHIAGTFRVMLLGALLGTH